ncbi:hypothetical protein FB556_0626 [Enteractinococcus coprophilus]|uniref:Uncharacterized protein n=1 Tax=Enteractinococcus coprophilus TaxID=1027633 RepID=A0A543ANM3_9MICC|nr:hypothetical protein FB556_0626 [Enteractinococcus coprophilus]
MSDETKSRLKFSELLSFKFRLLRHAGNHAELFRNDTSVVYPQHVQNLWITFIVDDKKVKIP